VARLLAENGFELILPTTVSREKLRTDDKQLQTSDQTHREWIYRQAFHMGRHIIGYEAQTVMAAVDWFRQKHGDQIKVGVCGYAEGGLVAFYTAALDSRIDAPWSAAISIRARKFGPNPSIGTSGDFSESLAMRKWLH
jgi:dienelactone hydrolase